jgi:hypothetical protein
LIFSEATTHSGAPWTNPDRDRVPIFSRYNSICSKWHRWEPHPALLASMPPKRQTLFRPVYCEANIVRKDEAYRKTEFARRCQIEIGGMPIAVVAPEDLVLSKLHWAKDSASELQQRDVRQILESVTDLDMSYIEKWAIELGVDELLQKARTS